jgi:hypothetical protein
MPNKMMNQIPIYLKHSADMTRPTDPEFFLVTGDGVFMGRNHRFFTSDVRAPRMPRSLAGHTASCLVNYPKLGVAALEYIVGFFDQVYHRHGSESIVLLFWNQTTQRYKLFVPVQEATVWESYSGSRTAMDVTYELPIPMPRDHLLVADIHCHCDFGAYTSLTDAKDEEYRDGVHAVVGHIQRNEPEFHIEISIDGARFTMDFPQLFKGFNQRRTHVPSEWFEQLTVKVKRPQTWSLPAS